MSQDAIIQFMQDTADKVEKIGSQKAFLTMLGLLAVVSGQDEHLNNVKGVMTDMFILALIEQENKGQMITWEVTKANMVTLYRDYPNAPENTLDEQINTH